MSTSGKKQSSSSSSKNQTRSNYGSTIKHSAVHKPVPGRGGNSGNKGNGGKNS